MIKSFSKATLLIYTSISVFTMLTFPSLGISQDPGMGLKTVYEQHYSNHSDINEHLPTLRRLSQECSSVVEIGIRDIVSTWGILQGLSESASQLREYLGIDINYPPYEKFQLAQNLSIENGIDFKFLRANDMTIQIPVVDMLFIDSVHTYCH